MHRPIVIATQAWIFACSGVAAFLLRFDFSLPVAHLRHLAYALPIWILVKIAVFHVAKLDRGWWRYVSVSDLIRVAFGNVAASAISCILILLIAPSGFPRSIYVLDLMVCFLATSGLRTHNDGNCYQPRGQHGRREEYADLRSGGRGHHSTQRDSEQSQIALSHCGLSGRPARQERTAHFWRAGARRRRPRRVTSKKAQC